MASDLDQLIEMGFDKERAQLAVSKSGGSMFPPRQRSAVSSLT